MQPLTTRGAARYEDFFGRAPDVVLDPIPEAEPPVAVYRFPPVSGGWWRRWRRPASDQFVSITFGMATREMAVPLAERDVTPSRIELLAHAGHAYTVAGSREDPVSRILRGLAVLPFTEGLHLGPGDTLDMGEPLATNATTSGYFFAVPDYPGIDRLTALTPGATMILTVVPLSAAELDLARDRGSDVLVARLEAAGIPPHFDLYRPSLL